MAARVLRQRVPRLGYCRGWGKNFTQAQKFSVKTEDDTDEQETNKETFQPQEASPLGGYGLYYSPSSYHHFVQNSVTFPRQANNDKDERRHSTLAPSFQRQTSHYSVSCSRSLTSSKNTLLGLVLNKSPEPKDPSVSQYYRKPISPDVKVDPRGFHKCRPEYADIALDLTQLPHPIEWEEALPLFQKNVIFKDSMKPSEVSHFFGELSRLHPDKISFVRNNQCFTMLLRYSVENLHLFTDVQLLEILQSFVWLDIPSDHTVLELYENELNLRANQMTLHQLLLAADLWRCIGRRVPQFLQRLYDVVNPFLAQMGVPEFVQLLYIIGEGRYCPADLIPPVERLLTRHLQQLYPEEVGIVCLGLFKSKTSISESAATCIVDKAHSCVKEMSDFAIVNVLKYIRFSYQYHRVWMEAMSTEVSQRATRMGVQALMHVALTCSAMHYRSDDILNAIAERLPSVVPHCRSKDSGKLLWAFGNLRFLPVQSPSFYPELTDALRQTKAEFRRFPEHLLTGLLGLAFVSQFPEDLIALALSPDFVKLALKSSQLDLKMDLLTLDGAVALELPHWSGPRLSHEIREETAEQLWKDAQSHICQTAKVKEAESALQDLFGGEKFVCTRMILPHTRSIDLEVHLDSSRRPIPVNPESHTTTLCPENSSSKFTLNQGWRKTDEGVILTEELLAQLITSKSTPEPVTSAPKHTPLYRVQPDERRLIDMGLKLTSELIQSLTRHSGPVSPRQDTKDIVKLAIQVPSRNHYFCNSQQLLGLHLMKRRHLKLAGYKVVELSHHEWHPLLRKSRTEKLEYLHCKVYNSL